MRIDQVRIPITHLLERKRSNTTAWGKVYDFVDACEPAAFFRSRPDVIKRIPDTTGWRKPTPWAVTVLEGISIPYMFTAIDSRGGGNLDYRVSSNGVSPNVRARLTYNPMTYSQLRTLMPSAFATSEAEVRALNAFAKRKGAFAESAAELRTSVKGLARNATAINDFMFAAIRKDYRGMCKALGVDPKDRRARKGFDRTRATAKTLGGAWLNFFFGLSPIVSDMVSAALYLSDEEALNKLRVHGFGYSGIRTKEEKSLNLNASGFAYIIKSYTEDTERSAACSLWFGITSEQLRKLAVYGSFDVPQTLWAIQPYSFLVDWVLPVSEILKAHTASVGATFKGGTLTRRYVRTTVFPENHSYPNNHFRFTDDYSGPGKGESMMMDRTVYSSPPRPVLPWIKDPLDPWKAITSLALLAGWSKHLDSPLDFSGWRI